MAIWECKVFNLSNIYFMMLALVNKKKKKKNISICALFVFFIIKKKKKNVLLFRCNFICDIYDYLNFDIRIVKFFNNKISLSKAKKKKALYMKIK